MTKVSQNIKKEIRDIFIMDIEEDFKEIPVSKRPKSIPPLDSAWHFVLTKKIGKLIDKYTS